MSLLDSEIELIDKMAIKDLIIEWLKKHNIKNYKINDDLTIDVNRNVNLYEYSESQLPDYIQFNEVNGWFDISHSNIKTLKGCSIVVNGEFYCSGCSTLETLEGAPKIVKKNFGCVYCDSLKTLKGAPEIVDGDFYCNNCKNLESLKGAPEIVDGNFYCSYCDSLKTLKGAPEKINGGFYCYGCPKLKINESDYKKYYIISIL